MLLESESESKCVETCPNNTLNLMNRECISSKSCEQENSKYWKDFKFVPSNGSCKFVKYCDSIELYEKIDVSSLNRIKGCQVVKGFVDIRFSFDNCYEYSDLLIAIVSFNEIKEIQGYLRISNDLQTNTNFGFLPNLKMLGGIYLESGMNSLVFDSNTGRGSHRFTSHNYTVSNEVLCTNNCDNSILILEITPKTYGFVVKILNEGFKNVLNDNVKLTSFVLNSNEYYGQEICWHDQISQ